MEVIFSLLFCLLLVFIFSCFSVPNKPTDTPETNVLLRYDSFPTFTSISPSKIYGGIAKVSFDFEINMHKHMANVESEFIVVI